MKRILNLECFAATCCLFFVGACGQTLKVKVERICDANVDPYVRGQRLADNEQAPNTARTAAAQLSLLTIESIDSINETLDGAYGVGASNPLARLRAQAEGNREAFLNLASPLTVGQLQQLVNEERDRLKRLSKYSDPASFFRALGDTEDVIAEKTAKFTEGSKKNELDETMKKIELAMTRFIIVEGEMNKRLKYGGFRSDTVFLINPGSREYEKVTSERRAQKPKLVFSKVEAIAAGDSVLLAVQENPAYFTMRYVSADPTEVVRNMLIATNRILRVATAFVPAVQGVGAALGTAKPGTGGAASPGDSASPEAAESAIAMFDEALNKIDDPELRAIIQKIKANPSAPISPDDLAKLLAKLKQLESVVANPTAPAPTS